MRMGSSSYPALSSKAARHSEKLFDETLVRIKEVIELCMEDSQPEHLNTFVGFHEVKIVSGA